MTEPSLRELVTDDAGFLGEMLLTAGFWRDGVEHPPAEVVLDHPSAAIYHRGWGRPGDTGLVAEVGGEAVGAVWYRLFTAASHGDGFVDEETPELAIAVRKPYRGRGIGTALLAAIHARARVDGIRRVSLSVDEDNPARRLYLAHGYRDFHPGDGKGRMVLELR